MLTGYSPKNSNGYRGAPLGSNSSGGSDNDSDHDDNNTVMVSGSEGGVGYRPHQVTDMFNSLNFLVTVALAEVEALACSALQQYIAVHVCMALVQFVCGFSCSQRLTSNSDSNQWDCRPRK
jgi:hypothetical protein